MSTHRSILRALRHPLWIASLILLVANDHLLKGSGLLPGWLTGKLSDVAGMFVAPPLLALLLVLALRLGRERASGYAHLAVGAGFAALELSSALSARLDGLYQTVGLRWVSTSDWTDLLALALLPLSHAFVLRASASATFELPAQPTRDPARRRPLELALAVAGLAASVATSSESEPPPPCDPSQTVDCDMDGVGVPEDCNDFDSSINPNAGNCPGSASEESCDNGLDDDNDGHVDCLDPKCATACGDTESVCAAPPELLIVEDGLLNGSTLSGSWALEGSCGGSDAPEAVFTFNAYGTGMLVVDVPEGHVVYARRQCNVAQEEVDCISSEPEEGDREPVESLIVEMGYGEQVTVIVDAIDGLSAGLFSTGVRFIPLGCGDETLEQSNGEQCDDGNLVSGDGCSDSCKSEAYGVCETAPWLFDAQGPWVTTFAGGTHFLTSACSEDTGGELAPERVYVLPAGPAGVLTVTASMVDYPVSIYAQAECGGASIACAPLGVAGEPTELALPVAAGVTLYIVIEGTPDTPLDADISLSAEFVSD